MNCSECTRILPDYLRGGVSPEEGAKAEEHLRHCAECSREAEGLRTLFSMLDRAEMPQPPEQYWQSFLPRVHEKIGPGKEGWAIPRRIRIALPVVVAALIAVFALRTWNLPVEDEALQLQSILGELSEPALSNVSQSVEVENSFESAHTFPAAEENAGADRAMLLAILNEERQTGLSGAMDEDTLDYDFTDVDANELVSRLEQIGRN